MTVPVLPVRLLALDIDGTLVGHDLVLRERTVEAIRESVRRGVRVSIATGRMPESARSFARRLGLRDPVISYQGAMIREMPAAVDDGTASGRGRLLYHRPIDAAVSRDAIRWCLDHGLDPHLNHLDRIIISEDDPRYDDYSAFLGKAPDVVPDLIAATTHPMTKVIALGEEPRPMQLVDEARRAFAGRAEATVSHPRFLEFVAQGVSKGRALSRLARRVRVPLAQTMAIGDALNDLEMLAAAGHGVAMPSAPAPVRDVARYVAPPLEEEGAAQMIEALVLAGRGAAANARRLAAEAEEARRERAETGGARR